MLSFHKFIVALLSINAYQSFHQVHSARADSPVPIVLWHGMGDSCCFSFSLGQIKSILENEIPDVYVYSIRIGNNEIEDVEHSYFGNINEQIQEVCDRLAKDEQLQNGYNAIGFSQGAQFLRAVAQRCPDPPMLNLISLGGQHQGVYGVPNCASLYHSYCDYIRKMLNYGAYLKFVQEKIIQSSYWHDPLQEETYKKNSIFLADINNELHINETYIENLKKLRALVLVKFMNDTMVYPQESEWFGFYEPGQSVKVQTLADSKIYKQDRLGLREMNMSGKVHFLALPTNHLQFTDTWFTENIIDRFLKD